MRCLTLLLVVSAAAAVPFAQTQDQSSLAAIRAACEQDAQKFCAGVQPGGGRIVNCLKQHKDSLSDACKQAAGVTAAPGSSPAESAAPPPSAPAAPAKTAPTPKATPTKSASAKTASPTGSEKFAERIITDPGHNNMRVATLRVPEKWKFESKMEWHYGWVEYPFSGSSQVENPDNAEAYFQYPLVRFDSIEVAPQMRRYSRGATKPGDRTGRWPDQPGAAASDPGYANAYQENSA